jgi:hypothetical protein
MRMRIGRCGRCRAGCWSFSFSFVVLICARSRRCMLVAVTCVLLARVTRCVLGGALSAERSG